MIPYAEIKQLFDNLSPIDQWRWLVDCKFKDKIRVNLDNDCTDITFNDDEDSDFILYFKNDIGDREGVSDLLGILGINAESV